MGNIIAECQLWCASSKCPIGDEHDHEQYAIIKYSVLFAEVNQIKSTSASQMPCNMAIYLHVLCESVVLNSR